MSADTSWRNKSIGEIFARSPQLSDGHEEHLLVLPQVNLLPAAITEGIALRKIRRAAILCSAVILVIAALVWTLQIPAIGDSQDSLLQAQATNIDEQAQVQALAPISQMVTQIKRQEALVKTTLAAQPKAAIIYQRLLAAAASAGSPAIRFTTLSVLYKAAALSGNTESACPDPDPFVKHLSIGCVTFSAIAGHREHVSRLLVLLGRDPMFVGPYVNSSMLASASSSGRQSVSFTGTVGISPDGLANPLTKEQATLLLNPPATPSASTGAGQ